MSALIPFLGMLLGTGDTVANKADMIPAFMEHKV